MENRGFLHFILHGANGLPAADFKLVKKPSSDPYCVATFGSKKHRTHTIQETLNPIWERAFSFQVGPFLPPMLLGCFGHAANTEPADEGAARVEFSVFDEDLLTADDALGQCTVDLGSLIRSPGEWRQHELALEPPAGSSHRGGSLFLSSCWEPAPMVPEYVLDLGAVVCMAAGAALLFLAANCRWQPASSELGAAKQPGVGAAALLGAIVLLLAAVVHFVTAHIQQEARIDDLVASQCAGRGLSDALSDYAAGGPDPIDSTVLKVNLKAAKLMEYNLSIAPTVDPIKYIHLPLLLLSRLLPIGGAALGLLALTLQGLQAASPGDGSLHFQAGEVCAVAAVGSTVLAGKLLHHAVAAPKQRKVRRQRTMDMHRRNSKVSETISSSSMRSSGQRRRDMLRSKIAGLFGSTEGEQ